MCMSRWPPLVFIHQSWSNACILYISLSACHVPTSNRHRNSFLCREIPPHCYYSSSPSPLSMYFARISFHCRYIHISQDPAWTYKAKHTPLLWLSHNLSVTLSYALISYQLPMPININPRVCKHTSRIQTLKRTQHRGRRSSVGRESYTARIISRSFSFGIQCRFQVPVERVRLMGWLACREDDRRMPVIESVYQVRIWYTWT
jgi:hypothetical protein